MPLLFSFLIGIVAGPRAMSAPAAALAARLGWAAVAAIPLAFMSYVWAVWVLGLLALVELVIDQLPATPSRTVPLHLGTRLATGALAGAPLAAGYSLVGGAALGLSGAVAGTLGGARARGALAARFGRDLPAAPLEDTAAAGGAFLVAVAA